MDNRFFNLLSLGVLAVLLAGCGPKTAPDPDRLPAQLTRDFFTALEAGDLNAADQSRRKLHDIYPEQTFFAAIHEQGVLAVRFRLVNNLLAAGHFTEAERLLRQTQEELGASPRLAEALDTVAGMQAVARYQSLAPFPSGAAQNDALGMVTMHKSLQPSPAYQAWLARQKTLLADFRRKEAGVQYRTLLAAYDQGLLAGSGDAAKQLQQLTRLTLDDARLEEARRLLTLSRDQLEAMLADGPEKLEAAWRDPDQAASLEIAFAGNWQRFSRDTRDRLALARLPAEPATAAGLLLRARLAVTRGNLPQAAVWSEQLLRRQAVSPELTGEGLETFFMPKAQFKAAPWRTPFPAVADVFARLEQLRRTPPPAAN